MHALPCGGLVGQRRENGQGLRGALLGPGASPLNLLAPGHQSLASCLLSSPQRQTKQSFDFFQ